jgi:hypothetical protein
LGYEGKSFSFRKLIDRPLKKETTYQSILLPLITHDGGYWIEDGNVLQEGRKEFEQNICDDEGDLPVGEWYTRYFHGNGT